MNEEKQKFVLYARLSSQKQDNKGLSLETQTNNNHKYVESVNGEIIAEFSEIKSAWAQSRLKGKIRHIFNEACDLCEKENATLLTHSDRIGRDMELYYHLKNRGIKMLFTDMPFMNEFALQIYLMIHEHYSDNLSDKIKAAMQTKRNRGDLMGYNAQKTHPNMNLHILFKHIPANVELIKSKKVSTMFMILKDYLDEYRQFNSILDFDTLSRPNDVTKKEDMLRVREACNHINKYCRADFDLKDESDNIDPITFRKEIYRITKIVKTFKKFFGDMTIQEAEKVCNDKQFITDYYNRTK